MPRVQVNDTDFYYESTGQGPPLVLLHGLGSCTRDWDPQVRAFAPARRVIAIDLRGHGQSARPPGPYSIPLFAADVAGILRALNTGPAGVVGLSLGGCVAFQLALDHPDLVASLVLVNTAPEFIRRSFKVWLEIWRRTALVKFRGLRRMGERISQKLLPEPDQAPLRAAFVERFAQNDPQAYLKSLKALIGWSVADRLESLRGPVLVVAAEHDYTTVAFKAAYTQLIPGARLVVIPGARHAVNVDRPAEFNRALAAFLAAPGAAGP